MDIVFLTRYQCARDEKAAPCDGGGRRPRGADARRRASGLRAASHTAPATPISGQKRSFVCHFWPLSPLVRPRARLQAAVDLQETIMRRQLILHICLAFVFVSSSMAPRKYVTYINFYHLFQLDGGGQLAAPPCARFHPLQATSQMCRALALAAFFPLPSRSLLGRAPLNRLQEPHNDWKNEWWPF